MYPTQNYNHDFFVVDDLLYILMTQPNALQRYQCESGFYQNSCAQSFPALVCFLLDLVTEDRKVPHVNMSGISLKQLIIIISSIIG